MTRPLALRVLRVVGVASAVGGVVALTIGALLHFDHLARIWAVVGGFLLAIGVTALLGLKPSRAGMFFGMLACLLLLVFPPVGTLVTATIVIIASQSWPQLRDYYRPRRRPA